MDELTPVSNTHLLELGAIADVPSYDRSALKAGIVHIGVGNFHRAHQAYYLHQLFEKGLNQDWAIIGAGVRAYDAQQREKLLRQDGLTTLIELSPENQSMCLVGSMIDYIEIDQGNAALIAQMAAPDIRIVSLTVTESGYYRTAHSGAFDATHEDIVHDIANPTKPRTAFGTIIEALRQRREAGAGPFTCLCCDNLQGNGDVLRQTVLGLAELIDEDLARWIAGHVSFPNTMVDCIVPATGPEELNIVRQAKIDDKVPVTHENFRQWVIEDRFCAGRPRLEEVGATFTDKVHDYEMMKIRILNGGHQLLANAGEILGVGTIDECLRHPDIKAYFLKAMGEDVLPHVKPVPDMNPADYLQLITKRFSNTAIKDTTRRVAFDGSTRHPGFIFPMIQDAMAHQTSLSGLALAEAIWARMCAGEREDGSHIEPNDPEWAWLVQKAQKAKLEPSAWLDKGFYGAIAEHDPFIAQFDTWLRRIWSLGLVASLRIYTGRVTDVALQEAV